MKTEGARWSAEQAAGLVMGRLLRWEGGMDRDDRTPVEWLVRQYRTLPAPAAAALAAALAAAVPAPEVELRAGGIRFFTNAEEAPDGGALVAALRDHPERYTDVPDPWVPEVGEDLRWQLIRAVAARCQSGDEEALALVKREALEPGRGTAVVASLMALDLPWTEAHAAEIVQRSPVALKAVLYHLQQRGLPVAPLITALRGHLPAIDLREAIEAELRGPQKDQALGLLPSS